MNQKPVALFLYTELAGYTLACLNALSDLGVDVHVISYPVNREAPFEFSETGSIRLYERKDFDEPAIVKLIARIQPSIIVVSGWIDKGYLAAIRSSGKNTLKILLLDNQWKGTLKQRIACLVFKLKLRAHFQKAWVPGLRQVRYAQKLGFRNADIQTGFYSCDFNLYDRFFGQFLDEKKKSFPRRFVYVGRYIGSKGISDLWNAFVSLTEQERQGWELWCAGTGSLPAVEHPAIRHLGFLQPSQMGTVIENTGVFVLPSHFEPWGVVVHEFAASGFPLICSSEVGAADPFLKPGQNGYVYQAGDCSGLKQVLLRVIAMKDSALIDMGIESHESASRIKPGTWAATAQSFCLEALGKKSATS